MNKFAIGDTVQFMHSSGSSSRMSFSTRTGKIVQFSQPNEQKALIKMRNGRTTWIPVSGLRGDGEKSPVDDVFRALVEGTQTRNSNK